MKFNQNFLLFLLFFLSSIFSFAAKRYWIGNGSNVSWSATSNWALSSGGAGGSSVPGGGDSVYFDSNGLGKCSIDANVSVRRFEMGSGYTDTVKQNGYTVTIGTSGIVLSNGVFWGGTAKVIVQGIFTLQGANFYSTKGELELQGNITFSSGNFYENDGLVSITKTLTINDNITFNNLSVSATANITITIASGKTVVVDSTFKTLGSNTIAINTGNMSVKGDIVLLNSANSGNSGGTSTITVDGTGNQKIVGTNDYGVGRLGSVSINKSSGTLYIQKKLSIQKNWTHLSGAVDAITDTSTVIFTGNTGDRNIIGSQLFYNVVFQSVSGGCTSNYLRPNDTIIVLGTFETQGSGCVLVDSGYISLKGDLKIGNTYNVNGTGGLATFIFSGTGNQTIYGATSVGEGRLGNIKIDKLGGTLFFRNYFSIQGDLTYLNGTVDATTYDSKIALVSNRVNNVSRNLSGVFSLNDLIIDANGSSSITTMATTDTIVVLGDLTFKGTGSLAVNVGTLKLNGDFFNTNTSTNSVNTGLILFVGNGSQIYDGTTSSLTGRLCNISIKKSSGTLFLKNYVSLATNANWRLISGSLDATTYYSTVVFAGGTRTIEGKQTFYNLTFNNSTNNLIALDTLSVQHDLKIESANQVALNTGVINVSGNITITNTYSASFTNSATIRVVGGNKQYFSGSGVLNTGRLCNIIVEKTSDTLFLSNFINVQGNWTYISGTVSAGSSLVSFLGNFNLKGANASNYMIFNNVRIANTRTLTGTLVLKGNLDITSGSILNGNSKQIYIGGNWINTGTFTYSNTTVNFTDTTSFGLTYGKDQRVVKNSGAALFHNIVINKSNKKVYLDCPVNVYGQMTFSNGIMVTTTTNILHFLDNSTVLSSAGSDSSYVSGPIKKTGNDIFTFPLGDTTLGSGAYHPLSITAPTNSTDVYTARYYAQNQTYGSGLQTDSLESISNCEYFTLNRDAGTSVVIPTISWNSNSCNVYDSYDVCVAGWNGTQWNKLGKSSISYNASSGTVSALSGLNLTLVPLVIASPKYPFAFSEAILKPSLDAGFYNLYNGFLKFKYWEEYVNNGTELDFKIYDKNRNVVLSNSSPGVNLIISKYRDNRFSMNLNALGLSSGYYILEVKDKKGEIAMLRFKK